jgi:hypothetical protein
LYYISNRVPFGTPPKTAVAEVIMTTSQAMAALSLYSMVVKQQSAVATITKCSPHHCFTKELRDGEM